VPDRSRTLTLGTGLAVVACAAGCGSSTRLLNSFDVERGIAQSMLNQHHVDAIVSCPSHVPRQKGRAFNCTANLQAGKYPVSVVEVDGQGHVRWSNSNPLVILNTERLQRSIVDSIQSQRGLRSQVRCPTHVLQKAGVVFRCEATVRRRRYPFAVTEVDGRGHVRYVGQ
jgi:hypothetical protein